MSDEKQLDIEDVAGDGSHLAQETLDALDGLDSEADQETESLALTVANQEQDSADRKAEEQARKNGAIMTAAGAVVLLEKALQRRWEFVTFDQVQENPLNPAEKTTMKLGLISAIAPVVEKHGGGMPPWMVPYKEEIVAVFALGGAAVSVYMQIKDHEKQQQQQQDSGSNQRQQHSTAAAPAPQPETPTSASIIDLGNRMQEPQE